MPLDQFYPWGEILLDDFDQIDKNLVDASYLFRAIREVKKIDDRFSGVLDDYDSFKRFWSCFSDAPLATAADGFIKFWTALGTIYNSFKKTLKENKIAYPGMLQRHVYAKIMQGELQLPWKKIIFAGFNFLNKLEKNLIRHLLDQNKALVFWDADRYYLDDPKMEAGHFIRRNISDLKIKEPNWILNSLKNLHQKNVMIIAAPLAVGQAKALGEILSAYGRELNFDDTVVVLPERKLLQPVLHSIPPEVKEFNITMGYPFRYTLLFSLFNSLRCLHKNSKDGKFYYKDITSVLLHPYMVRVAPKEFARAAAVILEKNLVYLSPQQLVDLFHSPLSQSGIRDFFLFSQPANEVECLDYVKDVLRLLYHNFISHKRWQAEVEHFNVLCASFNRLQDLIHKHDIKLDSDGFWKLFLAALSSAEVNFLGEPLRGLQFMGMLETRALDFKNVFILSLNEGVFPHGYTNSSFIPYALRKWVGLPTFDEHDAISAYNFYRLLQQAENVFLFYNTELDEFASGEKSRFLLQLENELLKGKQQYLVHVKPSTPRVKEITIPKMDEIMMALKKIEFLSASALKTYITCPLKFYLTNIAALGEQEELAENFTPANIGTFVHQIMAKLYGGYEGRIITREIISDLMLKLPTAFDDMLIEIVKSEYRDFKTPFEGMNFLYKEIIRKLVEKILQNDLEQVPFKLLAVEKWLEHELNFNGIRIKTGGIADRIEEKDAEVRILDYKTGKTKNLGNKSIDQVFELCFSDRNFGDWFQVYLYACAFRNSPAVQGNVAPCLKVGIYPIRSLGSGILYAAEDDISPENLNKFGERLNNLLAELFNPEIPFRQTERIENCKYCSFASICYREE